MTSSKPVSQKKSLPAWLRFWSSYQIAFWTLVLMAWATWLGTLYQANHDLLSAQDRFFESWLLFYNPDLPDFGLVYFLGEPKPWDQLEGASQIARFFNALQHLRTPIFPGGALLMSVLSFNLIGGVVRIFWQWNWNKVGALTGHVGVLLLMAAAAVSHIAKKEGFLSVKEGSKSRLVEAYAEPALRIRKEVDGVLQQQSWETGFGELKRVLRKQRHEMSANPVMVIDVESLPFKVEVVASAENVIAVAAEGLGKQYATLPAIDGVALAIQAPFANEPERNLAGAVARVVPRDGSSASTHLLFEGSKQALAVEVGGERWWIDLRQKQWLLPFEIRLDEAKTEKHPGTRIAAAYESYVTKFTAEGNTSQHEISMNHPLRTDGITLFQAKMSIDDAAGVSTSTFEVVSNPSDKWPEMACWVIACGLFFHFLIALIRNLRKRNAGSARQAKP